MVIKPKKSKALTSLFKRGDELIVGGISVFPIFEPSKGFIYLGTNRKVSPEEAGQVLGMLQGDIPDLLALRRFLLKRPPFEVEEEEGRIAPLSSFREWSVSTLDYSGVVRLKEDGEPEEWSKEAVLLHKILRRKTPQEAKSLIPLWRVEVKGGIAKLLKEFGALGLLSQEPATMSSYSNSRTTFEEPMLGVEFEIPSGGEALETVRRAITLLMKKGLVLAYERDASVRGGELKLVPFPATVEKVVEVAEVLEGLQQLGGELFEAPHIKSGLHVHINVWPLRETLDRTKVYEVVDLFQSRFRLQKMFGRRFNQYARRILYASDVEYKYFWLSARSLPQTVEVRLGNSQKPPLKTLLSALLVQRVLWAVGKGEVSAKDLSQKPANELVEALSSLFTPEEWRVVSKHVQKHVL